MYHLRRIKVLLAACVLACSSLFAQDVKVTISSATTNSQHTSFGPGNAIDGDYTNHWHSGNNSNGYATTFPVTFTIKFSSAIRVDYVRYNPRTDSSNGNWGKVKVEYCSSVNGTSFVNVGTYDLNEAGSSHDFYLNGVDGVTCGQIRFTIESGYGGWATASEIEAYQIDNTKPAAFAEYFNGDVYSELKPGVTSSDGIADADVKALVDAMLAGAEGYKKFRVGEYEPYMTTATVRNNLKTNSLYNNYENPTGIYLKRGESCIVAVSGIGDYPVGLKIKDWYKSGDLSTYRLRNGLNYITATTEGNVFVDYYTDDFKIAPNVQMHFINAPVLGYWDQKTMTNADWESMLAGPLTEDEEVIIITRSEHAQTAYPVKQWKTYCPANVNETMTNYQQVQWAERDILGLEMFDRQVKNRQLFYADKSGSMYAGGDASVCGYGDLRVLVTPDAKVFDFWGVGHEWGHNNQMAGFHWSGCGETTNNIPASWAQFHFTGNRNSQGKPAVLRLEDEVTGINDYVKMRGGRMQTYFEEGLRKGIAWQLQDGPDYHNATPIEKTVTGRDADGNDIGQVTTTSRNYDHFVKLSPFWQLNLWGTLAGKNENIIPKVIEEIRTTENYTQTYNTNGKQQINWMKLACDKAQLNLLPFFEKAGMLRPINAYIEDYGEGWNIITEEMINALKASVAAEVAAGRYQAYPDEEINYINGHNYHIYRDNLKLNVTSMEGERDGDKVTIQHSVAKNAVAFETYNAQGELIRITMYGLGSDDEHSFTQVLFPSSFDESENAAYIMAVGYDGERQRVYQTYANEDEAKYGELGRILTGVEAMKALCNDTKVGYYKSSSLTDLNAAYDIAKVVYDNMQSAKYAAVYDMLNTEFMKVQNDATARVGIVEGNAYRLENKGYTGRYMSINSEKMIVGETTELTDAQKWYFEASDTEGYYYIKNKSTQTYPGNVETSTKLYADKTTSSEAHAYKLQDMGNGLWALVGGTGLHQGSSVYDYGIVGWGADVDASQWYITVVETNTNAEALNNLQVLVNKAEALIAEIEADGAYSTISTETAQSKVATAKNYIASGSYNASVYTQLNEQYTALLNAKKNVDDAALDAKKLDLSTLISNANSLIAQCGTVTFNAATPETELALQTSKGGEYYYLSTNAPETEEGSLANLIDESDETYFHSAWSWDVNAVHYLKVDMGEGKSLKEFTFTYKTTKGLFPTVINVYGSNDDSQGELLHTFTKDNDVLPTAVGRSWTSSVISSEAAYRYIRFEVTESDGGGYGATPKGEYCFVMSYFGITEMAKPESYTVTLGNEAGDVTEELLLTAYKAVQEAQSVVYYANTEAQVNEAIEKLQAQYQALSDAKNAVQYTTFTITPNVSGGGVRYQDVDYTTTLSAPSTLTVGDLAAMPVDGYVAKSITVNGTTIFVIYNKVYTVKVTGGNGNGGVAYGEGDYMHNDTIQVLGALDVNQLEKIVPEGYELKEEITIDNETGYIHVVFSAIPLVYTDKYYTFECISEYAHSTERFIRDNGSVINGRSSEGSLFQFEKANDDNGYYIKSYVTDKYLNHANGAVYASSERLTIWKMEKPSHTPDARTLTVGNNLYLNNNDTDCTDNSCTNLQSKEHSSGVNSDNACSLWTITGGTPLDKSALNTLIGETNTLIESCYTDEELDYAGSLNVTEELMTATREAVTVAQEKYDSKATTESEYEAALNALQTVKDNLQTAINYANLPVQLTFDANSPVTYKIKIARANTPVLAYDENSSMVAVTTFELGNKSHGWYFMATTDGKVRIMPYHELNTTLALSTNSFSAGAGKVKGMAIDSEDYTQEWTITNADMNEDNRNAGWYNITCTSNGTDTWYFSHYGSGSNKMGFYNDANDGGSRFKFELISFDKSAAYYALYNYYHGETKVSGTITGGAGVGYYPVAEAETYNTAYSNATNILNNSTATDEEYTNAYDALKAANEALNLIMPEVGKYYTIVSACNDNNRNGQLMYATGENAMHFANGKKSSDDSDDSWIRPEALWTFTAEGYMMNLQTGCYVSTSGWGAQLTLVEDDAKVVSIEPLATLNGQVLLKPGGGYPLHAQAAGSKIVGYANENNASAWKIVEVDMSKVKHQLTMTVHEHAGLYLNYPVVIPDAVNAYIIDGSDIEIDADGVGQLTLTKLKGKVLPAQTAVILYAPEGDYIFAYTDEATDDVSDNLLKGSAYLTYKAAETGHHYYVFGQNDGEVGLYKNGVKYNAAGEAGDTHYRMSANKVLFDWGNTELKATSFRFRFNSPTTDIENIVVEGSVIFDLYGRRIPEVKISGLYIVDGVKRYIVVK